MRHLSRSRSDNQVLLHHDSSSTPHMSNYRPHHYGQEDFSPDAEYPPDNSPHAYSSSNACCRVVLVALCLCLVHVAGVLVSAYLLVNSVDQKPRPKKIMSNLVADPSLDGARHAGESCESRVHHSPVLSLVSSLLRPHRHRHAARGLSLRAHSQSISPPRLVAFLYEIGLNCQCCNSVAGAVNGVAWALLLWLLSYAVAICGCICLFGLVLNTLLVRSEMEHDVHIVTLVTAPAIPLLLGLLYVVCWCIVLVFWRRLKRRENQVFVCVH